MRYPGQQFLGKFVHFASLLFLLAITIWIRVRDLGEVSFWFDEACSWKVSQFPMGETLDAISRDAHPPLYFMLCKIWSSLFGTSVLAARSLSVMFGLLTVFAGVWYCLESNRNRQTQSPRKKTYSESWSVIAVLALIGLNSFQIELSREARPYTLGAFLAVVAAIFLLKIVNTDSKLINWFGFTIATTLLSFTHYYCLFTVISLYIFLLVEIALRWQFDRAECLRLLKSTVFSAWVIQLFWFPWWSVFLNQLHRANSQLWMTSFTWNQFASNTAKAFGVGLQSSDDSVFALIALFIWIISSIASIFSQDKSLRLVGICSGLPLLLTVSYSLTTRSILGDRYLLFAQSFLMINLGMWVRPSRNQLVKSLLVIGLFLWLLSWSIHDVQQRAFLKKYPGTKGTTEYLNRQRKSSTPVIINSPFVYTICWQYLHEKKEVYTTSQQDFRGNILSGPALRKQDLLPDDFLESRPPVFWTIDTIGILNQDSLTDVPLSYEIVSEERFAERYHFRMDHVVRKYRLAVVP